VPRRVQQRDRARGRLEACRGDIYGDAARALLGPLIQQPGPAEGRLAGRGRVARVPVRGLLAHLPAAARGGRRVGRDVHAPAVRNAVRRGWTRAVLGLAAHAPPASFEAGFPTSNPLPSLQHVLHPFSFSIHP